MGETRRERTTRTRRRTTRKTGLCSTLRFAPVVSAAAVVQSFASAAAGPMPAVASAASADIDVSISIAPGRPQPVPGVSFTINVGIGNAGPDAASARLLLDVPEGLIATSPNPLGCPTGTGTLDCGRQNLLPSDTSDAFNNLVAARPGSYTIVVRATELSVTDPNLANNSASLVVAVQSPNPAVTNFALSPSRPRAGAPLKASFAVVDKATGKDIMPSAVRCAGAVATTKIRRRGSVAAGRARCTFFPPRSAKGKTLRGSISATAEGKRLMKTFAVKLR